jgi:hypothetical protein
MNHKKIYIECAVRSEQDYNFKNPVQGFNFFQINSWEHKFFEIVYIRGASHQDEVFVIATAKLVLTQKFGKSNIIFRGTFEKMQNETTGETSITQLQIL